MSAPTLLARITAHRGEIVIEGAPLSVQDPDWLPAGSGRVGCLVSNAQERLGVSAEALLLLHQVRRGRSSLGEIMWYPSGKGVCFGWLGGQYRIVRLDGEPEGDRDFGIHEHVEIPNDVPEGAKAAIDQRAGG